ncbi:MAG: hypothetical protein ACYDBT_03580 [Desulfobulbaceae bacterium]
MYFIKYLPLKERLRVRSVSDRESLPYLISYVVILSIPGSIPGPPGYNYWDGTGAILGLIVAIAGILYAYRENGGVSGYDFILKFVLLGWVVFVRFTLASIPVLFFIIYIGVRAGIHSSKATGPFIVFVIFVLQLIFFQRVGRHIRDTKSLDR